MSSSTKDNRNSLRMCCQPKRRLIKSLERFGEISLEREYFSGFSAGRVEQSRLPLLHIFRNYIYMAYWPKTMEKNKGRNYMIMMQYEHQNFYHTHFSVLPLAFPESSPRAQLRSKRALKGRVRWEQILRMGRGEYEVMREIK